MWGSRPELLDIKTCPALDVRNQCSGFGLSVADQFTKREQKHSSDRIRKSQWWSDFTTRGRRVIFGDGAGANVLYLRKKVVEFYPHICTVEIPSTEY
jgi:3-oxoacyl-[acyl-carrier-protein] synthase III